MTPDSQQDSAHLNSRTLDPFITSLMENMKGPLAQIVAGEPPMRSLWRCGADVMDAMVPDVRDFVENKLRIPAFSDSAPHVPNLLLHELEESLKEKNRDTRRRALFNKATQHTLLINTSGAGKTRSLLEALTKNWGFYFICKNPAEEGIGSSDLVSALDGLESEPGFQAEFPSGPLAGELRLKMMNNQHIAGRLFKAVLMARLIIFNQFLALVVEHAKKQSTPFYGAYMRRWLELQVQPWTLGGTQHADIFAHLSAKIIEANLTKEDEKRMFSKFRAAVVRHLQHISPGVPNIYVVIDEGQEAVNLHPSGFSSANLRRRRPAIRELLFAWANGYKDSLTLYTFIVTGTGMSLDLFKEALSSSTMKQHTFAPFKKVGSFESQEQQETYIRKFVPPVLLETEVGRVLLERMWYWLEGRYRLTARFLSILLECGYEQPNALLDRYIMDFAGFLPTDCPQWVLDKETEAPFRPWTNEPRVHNTELDFERLKQNLKLFEIVTDTAYEYMLTSQNRHCLGIGNDQNELVELGFARIPHFPAGSESSRRTSSRDNSKGDVVVIDERLILSACAAWLNNYGDTSKAAAGVGDEEYGQDSDEEEDVSHKGLDNGVPEVMDGGDDPQGSANAATRRKRKANNTDTFKVYQDRNISSLYYWLSKRLKAADTNGRPLEEWLLLYMILAFGTSDPTQYDPLDPPRVELGDIFDFFNAECEDIRRLKNKRARLASVHFPERYRGCGIVTEHQDAYVFFRKNLRLEACSGALGHRSNDGGNGANRLMEWVKGERREMFCFPGKEMGPDLVFCLELHDGSEEEPIISYVWVMMQTKAHGSVSLRKEDVLSGIRSVTPSALYINSRYRNLTTEEIAQLSQKDQTLADQQIARNTSILEYLDNLPDREQECGGKHSVLRVLASWPAEVIFGNHISRRGQENMPGARTQCDPDGTDNHPLARLNHKRMIELTKDFSPTNKLINLLNAYNYIRSENTQPPQKRGNEESHPNDRSKRVRLDN